MVNEILLLSGNDIPFIEAELIIHQPRVKEIALMGEEDFFAGAQFLTFSKNQLEEEDKKDLDNKSDFDIFMSVMCSQSKMRYKNAVIMLFTLLFPEYQVNFTTDNIILISQDHSARINKINYDVFKNIINAIFELDAFRAANGDYAPIDKRAARIAEKLKKHKEKIAKKNGENKVSILSRYSSILSVGLNIDLNTIMNYTVFQLMDSFKRYQKKQDFDMYVKSRLAGAQDLEEVEHWMGEIHPTLI